MDDLNGRPASAAPTASSSSDFYDEPITDQGNRPHESAMEPISTAGGATSATAMQAKPDMPQDADGDIVPMDQDDSSSEMDLSDSSRSASPDLPAMPVTANADQATNTAGMPSGHLSAKRKLSETMDADVATKQAADFAKRIKLSTTLASRDGIHDSNVKLPRAVWQRVFLFLSPAMLCRCLRVCKDFKLCLTANLASATSEKDQSACRALDGEAIWVHSRKAHFSPLPRPLPGFSELEMLQLIGGRTCQFCGKAPSPAAPPTTVFDSGPGPNGVRVIWPFGIRTCGPCLEQRILKDVQVLGDATYRDLRLGAPHGFRSQDLHFVFDSVRQTSGIPSALRFSKVFYRPHLETIKRQEDHAKALGDAVAEEWHKGLAALGKKTMTDSARWERWELHMPLGTDLAQVLRKYDSSFPRRPVEIQGRSAGVVGVPMPSFAANGLHPLPQPVHVFSNGYGTPFASQPQAYWQNTPPPPAQLTSPQQSNRPRLNKQEVDEARKARKAEIERRCKELEPPLEPEVLQHTDAFKASMQITRPLTEADWEMLKPRILGQRQDAELKEHEQSLNRAALQAARPSVVSDDMNPPMTGKEAFAREYDRAQESFRKRLGEYADDCVNGQWGGAGERLDWNNVPIFAVSVLEHVRKRYREDEQQGLLPSFEALKSMDGQTTPPMAPCLSLPNMRWVYETKVRPLTDQYRRELFLCAGCIEDEKPKWFAFEGLIQHYGAKHTSTFSKGNVVVHWQSAEWPDDPPFDTNPGKWLKPERKLFQSKSHAKVRRTPQGSQGGAYPAHMTSNGYFLQQPPQPLAKSEMNPEALVTTLSSGARETWDALDGIQDLLGSIRMQTVIHHASAKFFERFYMGPSLDLFTEALATNARARPLKNVHALACKVCVADPSTNAGANHGSYWIRIKDAKQYKLPALITHFKLVHQSQAMHLDWTKDMIELPESQLVRELLHTPGMDDGKLGLIAAAFPAAFPPPLPRIGVITKEVSAPTVDPLSASHLLSRLSKKPQKNLPKKKGQKTNGHSDRDSSQEPLPEPTEDEYDPRRPMFVQQSTGPAADPAQFDTDARRPSPAADSAPAGAVGVQLDPGTLAAIRDLTNLNMQSSAATSERAQDRSPSVGRVEPVSNSHDISRVSAPPSASTGQPDIAAILASLTGQGTTQQKAAGPMTGGHGFGSASHQERRDVYGTPVHRPPTAYEADPRHVSAHHGAAPTVIVDPGIEQLQAALSRNGRRFEQNQHHHHHMYVEGSYVQPPPAQHREQYIYETEKHYDRNVAPTPVYREPSVQYVQMPPEREYAPQAYQYERAPPQPKPIYIDQYGRPLHLIPIDSAPAPAQYAPSPYEHPQHGRHPEQPVYPVAQQPHPSSVYDDRRTVYYDHIPPSGSRFAYDNSTRGSPR